MRGIKTYNEWGTSLKRGESNEHASLSVDARKELAVHVNGCFFIAPSPIKVIALEFLSSLFVRLESANADAVHNTVSAMSNLYGVESICHSSGKCGFIREAILRD